MNKGILTVMCVLLLFLTRKMSKKLACTEKKAKIVAAVLGTEFSGLLILQ